MSDHNECGGDSDSPIPAFNAVTVRARHDGWTADKQIAFIEALGETACVVESCARVGMSTKSAYALRARIDAASFRTAWDAALDYAIRRLSDAAIGRALNGISVPIFYQGEMIGERRRYDERLTMFLLRYRDPLRYAKSLDKVDWRGGQEGATYALWQKLVRLTEDAGMEEAGCSRAEIGEELRKLDRRWRDRPIPYPDSGDDVP